MNCMKQGQKALERVPLSWQGILWSAPIKKLDIGRDRAYIIHQVLMYGTLKQAAWLIKTYGIGIVRRVFLHDPQAIYSPPIFYFVKNFVLNLKKQRLEKQRYVKALY